MKLVTCTHHDRFHCFLHPEQQCADANFVSEEKQRTGGAAVMDFPICCALAQIHVSL
jgi:hypothetical protein